MMLSFLSGLACGLLLAALALGFIGAQVAKRHPRISDELGEIAGELIDAELARAEVAAGGLPCGQPWCDARRLSLHRRGPCFPWLACVDCDHHPDASRGDL